MIDIKTRIHDDFSVEFKQSLIAEEKTKQKDFSINTWIFVPNSLDVNPLNYGREQFLRDIKSYIRLVTPSVSLSEIIHEPFASLCESMNNLASTPNAEMAAEHEYQTKMFCSVFKSAIRSNCDEVLICSADELESLANSFTSDVSEILKVYRESRQTIAVSAVSERSKKIFDFGDEFMSNLANVYSMKVLERLEKELPKSGARPAVIHFLKEERNYCMSKGYPVAMEDDAESCNMLIHRHSVLKKFMGSNLFVNLKTKREGVAVEQSLYAVAAGLAMVFATVVAFTVQKVYGALSIPLFFALIFSYMIKDRIKELSRYWFVNKLSKRYFDNKSELIVKNTVVGHLREGVDFIDDSRIPPEVLKLRSRESLLRTGENSFDEHVILYRKWVELDPVTLDKVNNYHVNGINDIFRLHLARFTQKMDDPQHQLPLLNKHDKASSTIGLKTYHMNVIIQTRENDKVDYKRIRLVLTRDGIQSMQVFEG